MWGNDERDDVIIMIVVNDVFDEMVVDDEEDEVDERVGGVDVIDEMLID